MKKLSSRESEIVKLLTKGYLDKEIAKELNISVRTVQTYLRRIYIKLGARNRTNAVANFFKM